MKIENKDGTYASLAVSFSACRAHVGHNLRRMHPYENVKDLRLLVIIKHLLCTSRIHTITVVWMKTIAAIAFSDLAKQAAQTIPSLCLAW
jgi:hypothetical protein